MLYIYIYFIRLSLLDPKDDSQWSLNPEAHTNTIKPNGPLSTDSAGLGCIGNRQLEEPLSSNTGVAHSSDS